MNTCVQVHYNVFVWLPPKMAKPSLSHYLKSKLHKHSFIMISYIIQISAAHPCLCNTCLINKLINFCNTLRLDMCTINDYPLSYSVNYMAVQEIKVIKCEKFLIFLDYQAKKMETYCKRKCGIR